MSGPAAPGHRRASPAGARRGDAPERGAGAAARGVPVCPGAAMREAPILSGAFCWLP